MVRNWMLKKLPKLLALGGAGATTIAVVVASLVDSYILHGVFFRPDFMWLDDVAVPLLKIGIPAGFIGTILWVRQLTRSARIKTAIVLLLTCGLMPFLPGNIHGGGALLLLTIFPLLLLAVILLAMGFAARTSE
jgi:hypothetical protein